MGWQFWLDQGGTFTDVVAVDPTGHVAIAKVLSQAAQTTIATAVAQFGVPADEIDAIKIGTTIATNALLERRGCPTVLVTNKGLGDVLAIGDQRRPDLFALAIPPRPQLPQQVIEVSARVAADGTVRQALNEAAALKALEAAYSAGCRSVAISLVHGDRYPAQELRLAELAQTVGFKAVFCSHQVSPLMGFTLRTQTTVAEAYLAPVLQATLSQLQLPVPPLIMQSHGGLVPLAAVTGKDSLLSGPAGGMIGAIKTAQCERLIGFDMGGTSTDVCHFRGDPTQPQYERLEQFELEGLTLRAPLLAIHTVAAGGGSCLRYDAGRLRVGPTSAGSIPGPAAYGRGGPLTVTDANVFLGRLQPHLVPPMFGADGQQALNREPVSQQFQALATQMQLPPEQIAQGAIAIAIETMAQAISQISLRRGYDLSDYTLYGFGGAAGQHVCAVATALGIRRVLIHPYASVLSAYGIGLADQRQVETLGVERPLEATILAELAKQIQPGDRITLNLRYQGSDTALAVPTPWPSNVAELAAAFRETHRQFYGFERDAPMIIASLTRERLSPPTHPTLQAPLYHTEPLANVSVYWADHWQDTPVYRDLAFGECRVGPVLLATPTTTIAIAPQWQVRRLESGHLELLALAEASPQPLNDTTFDPITFELLHNRLRSIATTMGIVLQNTASSVNIKERLDFSCAIFDAQGRLLANAPHIPVHLGSMSACVRHLLATTPLQPGDVYAHNSPYSGGTHLPDITVISPGFDAQGELAYLVASRGHHADVGGLTPGSMPAHSQTIADEGIVFDTVAIVQNGIWQEAILSQHLASARNPPQNRADLQAQIAANQRGLQLMNAFIASTPLAAYADTLLSYSRQRVQRFFRREGNTWHLRQINGIEGYDRDIPMGHSLTYQADDLNLHVQLSAFNNRLCLDFSGSAPQQANNLNAPLAVTQAVILYVLRVLIGDDIPLNDGLLDAIAIGVPAGSVLNPTAPAAVAAGNVETSQILANTLLLALGVCGASQGTMNNLSFGNDRYQYYETLAGGMSGSPYFQGASAVQVHMTNSRLTDIEILESRYPVEVLEFRLREHPDHNGGAGLIRRLRFQETMAVSLITNHRRVPPPGLSAAHPGQCGCNWLERQDGQLIELPSRTSFTVYPGEVVGIATPSGGGS